MHQPSVTALHSDSLAFAHREVRFAHHRAQRAIEHRDIVGSLPIPELRHLADHTVTVALRDYRSAIGKRAFEIRQLSLSHE